LAPVESSMRGAGWRGAACLGVESAGLCCVNGRGVVGPALAATVPGAAAAGPGAMITSVLISRPGAPCAAAGWVRLNLCAGILRLSDVGIALARVIGAGVARSGAKGGRGSRIFGAARHRIVCVARPCCCVLWTRWQAGAGRERGKTGSAQCVWGRALFDCQAATSGCGRAGGFGCLRRGRVV